MAYRKPSYRELDDFAHKVRAYQPEAMELIEAYGFVFEEVENNTWQSLAYDLYAKLVEINDGYAQLFDDGE